MEMRFLQTLFQCNENAGPRGQNRPMPEAERVFQRLLALRLNSPHSKLERGEFPRAPVKTLPATATRMPRLLFGLMRLVRLVRLPGFAVPGNVLHRRESGNHKPPHCKASITASGPNINRKRLRRQAGTRARFVTCFKMDQITPASLAAASPKSSPPCACPSPARAPLSLCPLVYDRERLRRGLPSRPLTERPSKKLFGRQKPPMPEIAARHCSIVMK